MRLAAHSTRPPITVMGIKAAKAATSWVKRAGKGTEKRMNVDNESAAWAAAKVSELLRDCVAWLIVLQIAELGVLPEP